MMSDGAWWVGVVVMPAFVSDYRGFGSGYRVWISVGGAFCVAWGVGGLTVIRQGGQGDLLNGGSVSGTLNGFEVRASTAA